MHAAMDDIGNPSSIHSFGRQARKKIEDARAGILADLGLPEYRLAFTSGASEALAMVLTPHTQNVQAKRTTTHLLIAESDHVASLHGHGFADNAVIKLTVDASGVLDIATLKTALESLPEGTQAVVAVHAANNETGVLQPIEAISTLCDLHQALFVCDLVQWAGRLPLNDARPAAIIVSAHKLGGPAGVGALIYDPMRLHITRPMIRGGGQERGARAGTENAIGITGFASALHEAVGDMEAEQRRISELRDVFETGLRELHPDASVFGQDVPRLASTSCFALPGQEAALALMQLDLDGIAVSSGSACSSGKVKASHVLAAMNIGPELAACALRVSFGFASKPADVERLLASISRWSSASKKNSGKNANLRRSAIGKSA